ncbi:hypothetical protein EW093_03970 [Thiospirochaeta perfilievii]|uniref:4Fe-4S ferredoxin-type domain-containing protein n=1 Tax=Thiospirochaeta perfilievii TaxID=252967 RepID=A0A5C1Q8R4_9SPIO|nr:ATP-binding protein [Thiospirochaeta perfilievii]QEN03891.1 hypothetical protein EW093_03970 [Thiospirochaeta perfilievii]
MNIVVLSGKGGTGKTTVSINLEAVSGNNTSLLDCDVEEPNSHLFCTKPFDTIDDVGVYYPEISEDLCIHCGKCGSFCQFHAILNTKRANIVMPELCHDCGGCKLVCPVDAIEFKSRSIGSIRKGKTDKNQNFIDGILNTGEFSSTKIIQQVLKEGLTTDDRIIDAPPGSACAAVETVQGADLGLIVTEPTPFALSDMKMVVEMLENLNIETAVFINKSGENEEKLIEYCKEKKLPILGRLPFNNSYAQSYAEGKVLVNEFPEVKEIFTNLWRIIKDEY